MSGSFGEMGNLLAQAQKMQRAMEEARAELRLERVLGTAGGGVVTMSVNGHGEVESVTITPEAIKGASREELEELVLAAVRDGIAKATRLREERLAKVTGGLQLPGLM